jgi:hypothetical protein
MSQLEQQYFSMEMAGAVHEIASAVAWFEKMDPKSS